MEFKVSKATPIRGPDKCVWCMGQATRTYKLKGETWEGKKFRVEVYGPICKKHYILLKGKEVSIVVVIALAAIFYHDEAWPYLIYIASILIYILIGFVFEPVRIYEGEDFYEIVIRSRRYAKEFVLLNNLNPKGGVFEDGQGGGSGDEEEKERKMIEGGYFYEVYINNCFVEWSGFVDSFFLCYGAQRASCFRRGKIIKYRSSGKWESGSGPLL